MTQELVGSAVRDAGFVGREAELSQLSVLLGGAPDHRVMFLYGIAGIGKSSLITKFGSVVQERKATLIPIDCRTVEPTDRGFLTEFAGHLDGAASDLPGILDRIDRMPSPVVVTLDNYEVFRLLDTWLRQVFVPSMPPSVRYLFCGRQPPTAAWLIGADPESRTRSMMLGPLDDRAASELFSLYQVPEQAARRLNRTVKGHPLAIRLAASTIADRPDIAIDDVVAHRAVAELTNIYLAEVDSPDSRLALEAACCLRRVTRSLLQAMVPELEVDAVFDRLRDLPFVEARSDGLVVHEAVRDAVAASLRATDPSRYRSYRRAAWFQLETEVRGAPAPELWRYTADLLYMIENPVVREAFFPSEAQPTTTEPAGPDDLVTIEAISHRHDGPDATRLVVAWHERRPDCFSVIRDRDGVVTGFFYLLDTAAMLPPAVPDDPVVGSWWRHLKEHPVPKGQSVLGFRRWLDIEWGEAPCAGQAASWLDVKRTYMQLRPDLRRIYVAVKDAGTYWPIVERLGFRPITLADGSLDLDSVGGVPYASVFLDFGPGSVDGWLAGLVGAELGVGQEPAVDETTHELMVGGQRVPLTPLEFGVLKVLGDRAGQAVSRADLLAEVWGYDFEGETNVVNVVVSALRQKCGNSARMIETVRGVGYRMRRDWRDLLH